MLYNFIKQIFFDFSNGLKRPLVQIDYPTLPLFALIFSLFAINTRINIILIKYYSAPELNYYKLYFAIFLFNILSIFYFFIIGRFYYKKFNIIYHFKIVLIAHLTAAFSWIPLTSFPLAMCSTWFIINQTFEKLGTINFKIKFINFWIILVFYVIIKFIGAIILKLHFNELPSGFLINIITQYIGYDFAIN